MEKNHIWRHTNLLRLNIPFETNSAFYHNRVTTLTILDPNIEILQYLLWWAAKDQRQFIDQDLTLNENHRIDSCNDSRNIQI